ncbi:hypothetical protein [Mucilaginibacter gilvus]|uniref:Lipocalin-like domain-containing protein n=1 Tax=Mucilaginibacter gilvus TaxID=2305909 RepID=A0A444MKD9_9SPHI|nr:hypothetical protein [Mucilaginibacter gilvus]RWY49293.1 hypothetical protein EPL05_17950 [Mucilaginibacter gilvus]
MRKLFTFFTIVIGAATVFSSCIKEPTAIDDLKKSCLYDDKVDYFNKWANTFTEIDTYNAAGVVESRVFIHPIGYFQLNSNATYNVLSDNVPLSGKWDITDSCQLVLDPGITLERKFEVVKLTNDSLTLRRKDGNKLYTQHYAPYKCPTLAQLQKRWDNTYTTIENYTPTGIIGRYDIFPNGFFQLNADASYYRVSDGVPLDGTWSITDGCQLLLDKGTSLERSFQVQKVTADSLTIWRKDQPTQTNYLQNYVKH